MFEENILIALININPWNLTLYMCVWNISLHVHKKAITKLIVKKIPQLVRPYKFCYLEITGLSFRNFGVIKVLHG